jgi:hypothetical protein
LVTVDRSSNKGSGILWWPVIEADLVCEYIARQSKLYSKTTIKSGEFIFESAEDLKDNWNLVRNELEINFSDRSYLVSSNVSLRRNRVFYSFAWSHDIPESRIGMTNTIDFVKLTASLWCLSLFIAINIIGLVTSAFGFLMLYDSSDSRPDLSISIALFSMGILLFINSGAISRFIRPFKKDKSKGFLLEFSTVAILPLITVVIGLIIENSFFK